MGKKRAKPVDKIVNIKGVPYVVRYVGGIAIVKMALSDFEKYAKGAR